MPRLTYPQRTGVHPNTAFSLINALRFARRHPERLWAEAIREHAIRFFGDDRNYPFNFEPSGSDFLSAGLCEAVLMIEVLEEHQFRMWFDQFLPGGVTQLGSILSPVVISDPTDGQIAISMD